MKNVVKKILKKMGLEISRTHPKNDIGKYQHYFGKDSVQRRAFYNISAGGHFGFGGNFFHPCWTNIDVDLGDKINPRFDPSRDIAHDPLDLQDIPLESDSAELVQSRFAIEHISNVAAEKLFSEIYRLLKKEGVFRLVAPNFRLDYEAYIRNDRDYFGWVDMFSRKKMMDIMGFSRPLNTVSLQQVMIAHFAANASTIHIDGADDRISDEEFDYFMREYPFPKAMDLCTVRCSIEKHRIYRKNHINWWSCEKVQEFLDRAGFQKILFLSPSQSVSPVMRSNPLFDRLWSDVALYVEAIK